MQPEIARPLFCILSIVALSACGPHAISCGTDLEYDPDLQRCTCPDMGIYVCDSPDDCRCEPRDADAGEPDAGMPDDASTPEDARAGCAEGETVCGGACVDTLTDRSHCGGCSRSCVSGTMCEVGACIDAFVDLAAGDVHVCGVRSSGTVWCWGYGGDGQLGNGSMTQSPTPVMVSGIANAVRVDATSHAFGEGSTSTCAMLADATMWCWGHGPAGNLGDRGTMSRSRPVQVVGLSDARGLGVGVGATCAVLDDDTVTCWGSNEAAQLGTGVATPEIQLIPTTIPELDRVSSIDLSWATACALRTDGSVSCWGLTPAGDARGPTEIPEVYPAIDLALSASGFCALGADGMARCWGALSSTGVDDPTGTATVEEPTPVSAGSSTLRRIFAGKERFCGIDEDGVVCWGQGYPAPTRIVAAAGATDIAVGNDFACVIVAGRPQCWGSNDTGQLGTGTYEASSVPVPVIGVF